MRLCHVSPIGLFQISSKDRKLAFCNNCDDARYFNDCTKDYEIDRYRPKKEGDIPLTKEKEQQLMMLEEEQVRLLSFCRNFHLSEIMTKIIS